MTMERDRIRRQVHAAVVSIASFALLATACASPAAPTQGQAPSRPDSSGPRTLQLAFRDDPTAIHGGSSGTPEREIGELFNAGLTSFSATGELVPRLATKVPTVADGDWTVAPDGSMEVTWKIKPGLKWHDGAAFTAEDFAFAYRVFKDKDWPNAIPSAVGFIGEAAAPDAQTLILRYPRTSNVAGVVGSVELPPVPSHLLDEQVRQAGVAGIANHPLWTTDWVGMGPYKITSRSLGSQIDAAAFDDYVLGRPKIDRLVIKATNDAAALVARVLSGDVDMVPNNMEASQAAVLKEQWESSGRGRVVPNPTRLRQMQLQYRDPTAPWANDVRVRQAMLHLFDRQGLVDSVISGMSPVGHTALLPSDPAYALLEQRGLPKFPFDRAQGERLLDAAGWPRGADGLRRNAAGTIFRFNPGNVGESDQDETLVLVDGLKAGGISSEPDVIPETATDQNERRAKANAIARPAISDATYWERFITSQISAESNRWRSANTGGYSNPEVDRLVADWTSTLDPNSVLEKTVNIHKVLLDDLVALPLYYQVEIFAFRNGINGPGAFSARGRNALVDIQNWTIE
jgi:peptide/nickel transport system substrate-binding protein